MWDYDSQAGTMGAVVLLLALNRFDNYRIT